MLWNILILNDDVNNFTCRAKVTMPLITKK